MFKSFIICSLFFFSIYFAVADPVPSDEDGTRYLNDNEVSTLQRYAHYSFVTYAEIPTVEDWSCAHCKEIPGVISVKPVSIFMLFLLTSELDY